MGTRDAQVAEPVTMDHKKPVGLQQQYPPELQSSIAGKDTHVSYIVESPNFKIFMYRLFEFLFYRLSKSRVLKLLWFRSRKQFLQ